MLRPDVHVTRQGLVIAGKEWKVRVLDGCYVDSAVCPGNLPRTGVEPLCGSGDEGQEA